MALPQRAHYTADDYWGLPEGVRAELIGGELWDLVSPSRKHQEIVHKLSMHFEGYIASHGGSCKVYPAPFAVNLCDPQRERTLVYDFADADPLGIYPFETPATSNIFPGFEADLAAIVAGM